MVIIVDDIRKILGTNIKNFREKLGMKQNHLAKKLGIHNSTLAKYEAGEREPDNETLNRIAMIFETTTDRLLGRKDNTSKTPQLTPLNPSNMVQLPIIGTIRAGEPIMTNDYIEGYEMVEQELLRGRNGFVLRVKGDSMTGDRIHEGDKVIVVTDEDVTPTDIAVVAVNGDEATLKRVKCQNGICVLTSSNSEYPPFIYNASEIKILGKVIQVRWDL